jgi:UrcA family protein
MNAKIIFRKSAALIVSMLVLGFAQGGLCVANQWGDALPSVTVSYADLDLSQPQGARTLFHRLEEAAETVCAPAYELVTTFHEIRMQECEHRIIKGAVIKIGRPSLYAVYDAKYHEVLPSQAPRLAAIRSTTRASSRSATRDALADQHTDHPSECSAISRRNRPRTDATAQP